MTDLTIERMREIRDCIDFAAGNPRSEWLGNVITDAEMIAICDIAIAAKEQRNDPMTTCACMGRQGNDPLCPCQMVIAGLRPPCLVETERQAEIVRHGTLGMGAFKALDTPKQEQVPVAWVCFHCGEVFTTRETAAENFWSTRIKRKHLYH